MKTFVVFGASALTMTALRDRLSAVLDISFRQGYSDYWGGDYFQSGDSSAEHLRILNNVAEDEDDLPYLEYKDVPVILEVNYATESTIRTIESSIDGLVLLRRKDRDS